LGFRRLDRVEVAALLEQGFEIEDYVVDVPIGKGGMGVVYRAIDRRLDRAVAVKVLNEEIVESEGFEFQFLEEARSAASVDHPNVLPIYAFGQSQGLVYMVSRLARKGDLTKVMSQLGPEQLDRTAGILDQTATAIDAVHAAGVLHLDVKPSNLLLDASGSSESIEHVYLADFGLSFLSRDHSEPWRGKLFGTADYMAPEYIAGGAFDSRSDIFALACVAFRCLSGQTPFGSESLEDTLDAQVNNPVPPLGGELGNQEVDEVFAMALAREPKYRFQNASAFMAALRSALDLPPRR